MSNGKKNQVEIEIERLVGVNSENEKQIDNLLYSIGKDYYEKHKNEAEGELADRIATINSLYSQIEENNNQIMKLKNMKLCPDCGGAVAEDARFCCHCGHIIAKEEPVQDGTDRCPVCGHQIEADAAFCSFCGHNLSGAVEAVDEVSEPEEETVEIPRVKYCPNCHEQMDEDAVFCYMCGASLTN